MQPTCEVAHILHKIGKGIDSIGLNGWQLRTLSAIKRCRTAELGGHVDACDGCGNISISYNSCRNRHCPKCQGSNREEWIKAREAELLPVSYFHVVFTLPSVINSLAMHAPKQVYDTLFEAAWETIACFGKNKGVHLGMISVLHTWGQNLSLHPHLHCIVPGGGVEKDGQWKQISSDGKYLFSVKAMSKVFRAKYCEKLKEKLPEQYLSIRKELWGKDWVVYAKRPFGDSRSVIEYLGRYTHKVAISNHRIKAITDQTVDFVYKDYKQSGIKKVMRLTHSEFIRRFAQHILPKRFVKIRHHGILSSTWKRSKLKNLQEKLHVKVTEKKVKSKEPPLRKCPCCGEGRLFTISVFFERGPPVNDLGTSRKTTSCIVL